MKSLCLHRAIVAAVGGVLATTAMGSSAVAQTPSGPLIPRDALFAPALEDTPQVALDGQRVAFLKRRDGRVSFVVAAAASPGSAQFELADHRQCITDYDWAADNRHVILQEKPGCTVANSESSPSGFRIARLDVQTGSVKPLPVSSPYRLRVHVGANVADRIALTRDARDPGAINVETVNLQTGQVAALQGPFPAPDLAFDDDLQPRLATRRNATGGFDLLSRHSQNGWTAVATYAAEERHAFRILGFSRTGRMAFLLDPRQRTRSAITAFDFERQASDILFHQTDQEPRDALIDLAEGRLLAVQIGGGRAEWVARDAGAKEELDFLPARLDGDVSIASRSRDDRIWIVRIERDVARRQYVVFDRRRRELHPIERDDIKVGQAFVSMNPVVIPTRDGTDLTAYLTRPDAAAATPLVLLVHGGPAMHSTWGFDATTQWLANRGYAVLSVNFRGSTGSGSAFTRAGHGEWGAAMQNDLTDATDWAIAQGIADPHKIAIVGHSYGGYATMMGLAQPRSPFACGINMAGPVDLLALLQSLESFRMQIRTAYQKQYVESQIARYKAELQGKPEGGLSEETLGSRSPINRTDLMSAPLLMIYGDRDLGISPRLFERLARRDHPAGLVVFANEGHVISRPENVSLMAGYSECFLARCLGGRVEPTASPAPGTPAARAHSLLTSGGLQLTCP